MAFKRNGTMSQCVVCGSVSVDQNPNYCSRCGGSSDTTAANPLSFGVVLSPELFQALADEAGSAGEVPNLVERILEMHIRCRGRVIGGTKEPVAIEPQVGVGPYGVDGDAVLGPGGLPLP